MEEQYLIVMLGRMVKRLKISTAWQMVPNLTVTDNNLCVLVIDTVITSNRNRYHACTNQRELFWRE